MASQISLILRRPRSGRLEGRTTLVQGLPRNTERSLARRFRGNVESSPSAICSISGLGRPIRSISHSSTTPEVS